MGTSAIYLEIMKQTFSSAWLKQVLKIANSFCTHIHFKNFALIEYERAIVLYVKVQPSGRLKESEFRIGELLSGLIYIFDFVATS